MTSDTTAETPHRRCTCILVSVSLRCKHSLCNYTPKGIKVWQPQHLVVLFPGPTEMPGHSRSPDTTIPSLSRLLPPPISHPPREHSHFPLFSLQTCSPVLPPPHRYTLHHKTKLDLTNDFPHTTPRRSIDRRLQSTQRFFLAVVLGTTCNNTLVATVSDHNTYKNLHDCELSYIDPR